MLNKLKASDKLYLLVFVMSVFIIGIGAYGIREIKKIDQYNQTLYADRVVPIEQLTTVRYTYLANIISPAEQTQTHRITFKEAIPKLQGAEEKIAAIWKAYLLTYLTPEEDILAKQASVLIDRSNKVVEKLKVALAREDAFAAGSIIQNEFYPVVNPIISKMNELIDLQVNVGEKVNNDSKAVYKRSLKDFILLIILCLLFAVPFCYYLVRSVKKLIRNLHKSNKAITKSEEKYRTLIENAGDAIFMLDKDTFIRDMNHYACKLLGYSREELTGMKISSFLSQKELEKQLLFFEQLKRNITPLSERRLKRKDGSEVDTEINTRILEDEGYISIVRDITERKRTEEQLKEYKHFFYNSNDPSCIANIQGHFEILNPQFEKILGYTEVEMLSNQYYTFIHPDDIPATLREVEKLKAGGTSINFINRYRKKDGEYVWFDWNTTVDPVTGKLYAIARDITERKKIEAELAEHKEQLTLFIEHSPASLAMFDNEMRYIATSRRWVNDYNVESHQLIGKNHYEVFPEIPQRWKDIHQRCLKGEIQKMEEDTFIRPNGNEEWIRWEIRPWHKATGEIGGIIMFTEVITERKRATELFKRQFENSPDIILIIDREFKIESINHGLAGGPPVEEVIGINSIDILPEESREAARNAVIRCFETGQNQEVEGALRFGKWARSRFVPIIVHDGSVTHIMIISTDITERKKAAEKIIQSEARLKEAQAIALLGNWEIDLLNDIHLWSDEFYKIFGTNKNEVQPSTEALLSFMHPDDRGRAMQDIQQAFTTFTNSTADFRLIRKDGTLRYAHIEWRFEFDKNSHPIRLYGILQDITERKKAEESIRQSEANYRQLFDLSPAPMWLLDEGTYKFNQVNQACINHYGYTAEEFAGMTIEDISPDADEKRSKNATRKKNKLVAGFMGSGRHVKRSGEIMDVVTSSIPVVLNGKKQILLVAIDVTERNLYEQKLTRAAIKAQEDERYEIGGELHDNVCQILATSLLSLRMMERSLPAESKEFFGQTQQYITLASREIRNLSHRLAPAFFDDASLEDAFKSLLHSFNVEKKYRVSLDFDRHSKNYPLSRDLQLNLYRILQEQLRNIMKYAKATSISVKVGIVNDTLQMRIEDNGIGFDVESIKSGIGLANMNRRARLFSGNFTIESELGNGCEIKVEMPLSSAN